MSTHDYENVAIDELLDEIEENERHQEKLRGNGIQSTQSQSSHMASPRKKTYRKVNDQNALSIWVRKRWQVGSFCEIYSMFFKKWFPGKIKRAFNDNGAKWLEIQYMAEDVMRTKYVAREDAESVRPFTKAMHIYSYIHNAVYESEPKTLKI